MRIPAAHEPRAGGNGRGLAPRPTIAQIRERNRRLAEHYRQQRETEDADAIAEGKMPPSQIRELKAKLKSDPNLRVLVCAQLAVNVVLARPELAPNGTIEEVAVLAGQAALLRSAEMDKTLTIPGGFWDMSESPFEVSSAVEGVEQKMIDGSESVDG